VAKKIIGLVGKIGSGKTVLSNYLVKNYGASYHRFSKILEDVLVRLKMPLTRDNYIALGIRLRELLGADTLVDAMKYELIEDNSDVAIVDGVRYPNEAQMIRKLGGVLVYIDAPTKTRYERVKKRGEKGEREISYEEFLKNEKKKTELMIDELGRSAEYRIVNDGSYEEYEMKIKRLTSELLD